MTKKLLNLFATVLVLLTITSCASTKLLEKPATLTKHDNAMFWELNATDKNGAPSTVYVLGTFHAGDDRMYPLPTNVVKAFVTSQRIAGEISSSDFNNMMKESISRIEAASKREIQRINETHTTWADSLSSRQLAMAQALVGGEANFTAFVSNEPWVFLSAISVVPISYSGLDPSKGYDFIFTENSKNAGRTVEGLDDLSTQLDIIQFGDWNTQIDMVKDTLNDLLENQDDPGKEIKQLYEAYLSADPSTLENVMEKQMEGDTSSYSEDFNYMVFTERNIKWATKFANYLNEGGITFVFAGCGHFIGPDSVFVHMSNNGDLKF